MKLIQTKIGALWIHSPTCVYLDHGGYCSNLPATVKKNGRWFQYGSGYKKSILETPWGQENPDIEEILNEAIAKAEGKE